MPLIVYWYKLYCSWILSDLYSISILTKTTRLSRALIFPPILASRKNAHWEWVRETNRRVGEPFRRMDFRGSAWRSGFLRSFPRWSVANSCKWDLWNGRCYGITIYIEDLEKISKLYPFIIIIVSLSKILELKIKARLFICFSFGFVLTWHKK